MIIKKSYLVDKKLLDPVSQNKWARGEFVSDFLSAVSEGDVTQQLYVLLTP